MCRPRRARRLRHGRHLQRVQLVADPSRDVQHPRERRVVVRIEIERDVVGLERRLHAREPRVLRDRRNLRHVEQRDQRAADKPPGVRLGDRLDARRRASRCARRRAASPRDAAAGRTPARRRRSGSASSPAAGRRPPAACSGATVRSSEAGRPSSASASARTASRGW